ncbi:MAG: hypothetical protein MUO26_00200 [Methanotrichaceae archaeon]|nr:hypothetical protein [Methanotrichaceae archaeon]
MWAEALPPMIGSTLNTDCGQGMIYALVGRCIGNLDSNIKLPRGGAMPQEMSCDSPLCIVRVLPH